MPTQAGPIYEVTLFVERDVVAACDQRLDELAGEAPRFPGVASCHVFAIADDDPGRAGRICQYTFASDEALDDFLDGFASSVEAAVSGQFGNKVEMHSRVLREDLLHDVPLSETPTCLNCGTHLRDRKSVV